MPEPDTYTVAEAAKLLGLSTKRVRQLTANGKLEAAGQNPLTLGALSVLALRDERAGAAASAVPTEQITQGLVKALEALERAHSHAMGAYEARLAISDRAEAELRDSLHRERARVAELELQLEALREQLNDQAHVVMVQPKRSRWFRRSS